MLTIGESINAAIPSVGQAITARDSLAIAALARGQVECGAQMLDVNAGGLAGRDESADLSWLIQVVQDAVAAPLVLDSDNPDALLSGIKVYRGSQLMLSSVNGEASRIDRLLPLALERQCGLVLLCMDDAGIPSTPEGRLSVAARIIERSTAAGVRPENLYVDPLVMSASADYRAGDLTLGTLRLVREAFPQARTISGISNISFGLPRRQLLNRAFAAILVSAGLDACIVDVRDQALMQTLLVASVVTGRDQWCRAFLKAYRSGKLEAKRGN